MSAPSSLVHLTSGIINDAPHLDPHLATRNIVAYTNRPATAVQSLQQQVRRYEEIVRAAWDHALSSPPDHRSSAIYSFEIAEVQLQEANTVVCHAAVNAARAAHRRRHPDHDNAVVDASVEVTSALLKLSEAKVAMWDTRLAADRAKFRMSNIDFVDAAVDVSNEVASSRIELSKAKVMMRKAAVDAARAVYRHGHPRDEDAVVDASFVVSRKLRELREAVTENDIVLARIKVARCELAVAAARAEYRRNHPNDEYAVADASVEVAPSRIELSEAKVEMCKAAVEAARAVRRRGHPGDEDAVVDASFEVSCKLRSLREAETERSMLPAKIAVARCQLAVAAARAEYRRRHPNDEYAVVDVSEEVAPSRIQLSKAKFEMCQAAVDAARAVYRRGHPRDVDAVVDASFDVSCKLRSLREAETERSMLPAKIKAARCELAVAAARAEYRRDHPNDDIAVVDASVEVTSALLKLSEAKVAMWDTRLAADRAKFRMSNIDFVDAAVDVSNEVAPSRIELSKAKVEMCEAAVEAARAVYRKGHPGHEDAVVNASFVVSRRLRELREAKMERAMLPTKIAVARCEFAVAAARTEYRRDHPNDKDVVVDASLNVSRKLRELREAEKERAMLPAKIKVARCELAVAAARATYRLTHPDHDDADMNSSGDVFSALHKLNEAEVEMRMAAVEAACAVYRCKHPTADEVAVDLSDDVSYARLWLHNAEKDRDMLPGTLKVAKCTAEVEKARRDHPHDDDASERISSKLTELRKAERDRDMLPAVCKVERCKNAIHRARHDPQKSGEVSALLSQLKRAEVDRDRQDAKLTVDELNGRAALAEHKYNRSRLPDHKAAFDDARADLESAKRVLEECTCEVELLRPLSFACDGLPGPIEQIESSHTPHRTDSSFVYRENEPFMPLSSCPMEYHESFVWILHSRPGNRKVACVADVLPLVKASAEDAVKACGAPFYIRHQVPLKDEVPNLTIFSDKGACLSVIEVTSHGRAFEEEFKHKVRRCLSSLRIIHGISYPIAILSSYNGWQFCWPEYATPVAEAMTLDEIRDLPPNPPSKGKRGLCASKVYKCNDPDFNTLLASFMLKLSAIPRGAKQDVWDVYTRTTKREEFAGPTFEELMLDQMPRSDAEEFTEVKFLGSGTGSIAFLVASESGSCCVAKFGREARKNQKDRMARERDAWWAAYGEDCQVRLAELNNRPALLMPYHEVLTNDDWQEPAVRRLVMEHIGWLASRGVRHHDIERRHVVWVQPSQLSAAELDLVRLKLIEEGNDVTTLTPADLRARAGRNVRLIDWGEAGNNEDVQAMKPRKARKTKKTAAKSSGLSKEDYLAYSRRCLGLTDEDEGEM